LGKLRKASLEEIMGELNRWQTSLGVSRSRAIELETSSLSDMMKVEDRSSWRAEYKRRINLLRKLM